jgi:hypothetical protein
VTYGKCTGQQINQAKCSIMFNDNCQQEVQAQVKSILQVERTVFDAKYLGRMKGDRFQHLKERLSKRLKDYSEKNISIAAKEVLIKLVAQALRTYIMSRVFFIGQFLPIFPIFLVYRWGPIFSHTGQKFRPFPRAPPWSKIYPR